MSEQNAQTSTSPKVDINRVGDFLSRRFREATDNLPRAANTPMGLNIAYKLQQEFCYRLDEIQRGPVYLAPKLIQQLNVWIGKLAAGNYDAN